LLEHWELEQIILNDSFVESKDKKSSKEKGSKNTKEKTGWEKWKIDGNQIKATISDSEADLNSESENEEERWWAHDKVHETAKGE
jgi:hypothetical protein